LDIKKTHNNNNKTKNQLVEVVDKFKYLGVTFSYNGSMKHAVDVLPFNHLLSLFYRVKMDVKTMFDTLVVPILLYCSDVLDVYNHKDIDKLHLKYCKTILGLRPQTPNIAVFGELGRFPLSVICKERTLKFLSQSVNMTAITLTLIQWVMKIAETTGKYM